MPCAIAATPVVVAPPRAVKLSPRPPTHPPPPDMLVRNLGQQPAAATATETAYHGMQQPATAAAHGGMQQPAAAKAAATADRGMQQPAAAARAHGGMQQPAAAAAAARAH
eukprot:2122092-Alexandrium_andersonii.AAC.1